MGSIRKYTVICSYKRCLKQIVLHSWLHDYGLDNSMTNIQHFSIIQEYIVIKLSLTNHQTLKIEVRFNLIKFYSIFNRYNELLIWYIDVHSN